ncbi:PepSY-associated TM helix domain-containing protein [Nocardioides abyssi]|uniref:PepSY domain-containing protein n=1 Tax=Nocardioides abyssi TaxID=3058370 RepID=A0ABT8EUG1_9ACTN|nr:PepSY domain-containing protein [Nocardioides abyssi]MDN4161806.1 PepSY domain-containing protein [Nocardioides abyssi]
MTDLRAPERASDAQPPGRTGGPSRRPSGSGLFRAVWRWHFFASFVVVPVLLVLAVTGLIYLFRFQLEPLLHPDLMKAEPTATQQVAQPYSAQLAAVRAAYPDVEVVSLAEPREDGRSTVFSVVLPDGEGRDVYVDPFAVRVLGSMDPDTTLSGTAVRLHADLMSGRVGDMVMELGACWAIVMAITGYYLFLRGRRARRRLARSGRPGARLRSRHGAVGAVVGVGLLTLLVSGLPWTGFWGAKVQELATAQGSSLWSTDHGAISDPVSTLDESLPHSHLPDVPWAQHKSEVPRSEVPEPGADGEVSVANVDTAVVVAEREGLRRPFTIALPSTDDGVFSVIGYAFDAPTDERTVHVDRYGGEVVDTYGYDDYPALAKVVAHGIGLHEGRSLGLWSFWGAALLCLGVVVSCVTGPLMWWRRRPRGRSSIGAPRGRMPLRATPALTVGILVLGVLLPFFGITLLAALLLDQLVLRRVPALAGWFDRPARA